MRHRLSTIFSCLALLAAVSVLAATQTASKADRNILHTERMRFLISGQNTRLSLPQGADAIAMRKARTSTRARSAAGSFGSIAGTMFGLDETARLMAFVEAFAIDSSGGMYAGWALPDENNQYRIDSLLAGSYYVFAWADSFEAQYYNGVVDITQATLVDVVEDQVTAPIDFTMVRLVPGTGVLSGTVVAQGDGSPIPDAWVFASSTDFLRYFGQTTTDAEGRYSLQGLKTGSYFVEVYANGFLWEIYNDASSYEQATPVEIIEPNETYGIDFSLSTGGSISGRVTDDSSNPLAEVYVEAVDSRQDSMWDGWSVKGGWGYAYTDGNGDYLIGGLDSGSYWVHAQYWTSDLWIDEWYDDVPTMDQATSVEVRTEEETADIDFVLSFQPTTGSISGTVTDENSLPVAYASVYAETDYGPWGPTVWSYTNTDENGLYTISGLPESQYRVSCYAQSGWRFVQLWWPDAETPEQAQPVSVIVGTAVDSIDFVMTLGRGSSSIAGKVRSMDGRILEWAFVEISPTEPAVDSLSSVSPIWAYAYTDSSGQYRVDFLPAGSYIVHASHWESDRFGQQWYDHAGSPEEADPVVLVDNESRESVDFDLDVRPIYGTLAGTITDASNGGPIIAAFVEIKSNQSDFTYRPLPFMAWDRYAITDGSGRFLLEYLPEGNYWINVYADGGTAAYDDSTTQEPADPVFVLGGGTTSADVAVSIHHDGPGTIRGNVGTDWGYGTDDSTVTILKKTIRSVAGGNPLYPAVVQARPISDSDIVYTALTDSFGDYSLWGLAPGEYIVSAFAPYFMLEYYENTFDPSQAAGVLVDSIGESGPVEFELSPIWYAFIDEGGYRDNESASLHGIVTDESGTPVAEASIHLYGTGNRPVSFTSTDIEGRYIIDGLAPGSYVVQAGKPGYDTEFNDNAESLSSAIPLNLANGSMEIDFVLHPASTSVEPPDSKTVPKTVVLYGNFPNPFNPETLIRFALPNQTSAEVRIFNPMGQTVTVLASGSMPAGNHSLRWDGLDMAGQSVPSGVYIVVVQTKETRLTGKMLLLR